MQPLKRLLLPEVYNLRVDPKELHNIVGGDEGIVWGLLAKDAEIQGSYEKSFQEFPNADYSMMTRSK